MNLNVTRIEIVFIGLIAIVVIVFNVFGIHINFTESYPRGLWVEVDGGAATRPYVLACADHTADFNTYNDRDYLPWGIACSGTAPLLKRIWARPGDSWSVSSEGVRINGELVENSKPLDQDSAGRPLPRAKGGIVPPGHVLLLSNYSVRSLDGRYFGTMPSSQIIKEVEPLWTE